jgi:hypothetical protein
LLLVLPTDTVEEVDWELRQSGKARTGTLEVSDQALLSAAGARAWLDQAIKTVKP